MGYRVEFLSDYKLPMNDMCVSLWEFLVGVFWGGGRGLEGSTVIVSLIIKLERFL